MTRQARAAIIYYSATGSIHRLAHALAEGAAAEARRCASPRGELASELLISQNQYWGRHRAEVEDEPVATLDDLEWADGVAFGIPASATSRRSSSSSWTRQGGCGRRASSPIELGLLSPPR